MQTSFLNYLQGEKLYFAFDGDKPLKMIVNNHLQGVIVFYFCCACKTFDRILRNV
jgi:hypothetical protein